MAGAAEAEQEGEVAGRQEDAELPGVGVEAGEVLEVTVDEGALEASVVVVAAVAEAGDSEEEVVVGSEVHDTSDAQNLFFPTIFHAEPERTKIAERNESRRRRCNRSYGLRALISSSASLSLLIRSSCVLRVYDVTQRRVRA